MERAIVRGVRACAGQAALTVDGAARRPGGVASVLRAVAAGGARPGLLTLGPELVCTLPAESVPAVRAALAAAGWPIAAVEPVALVTVWGAGLRGDPLVPMTFCEALARSGVRLGLVSLESGQLTAACPQRLLGAVLASLREAFETEVTQVGPVAAVQVPAAGLS